MIKGLLKKDLYNLASYKTTLIIVVLFCGIAIIGTDAIYWGSVVIGIIVGMISLSRFSYDEMSKSNKYILTLPVTRKEIVLEKYVLAIGATILGGILGFIVTLLVGNVMNYLRPDNLIDINIETLLATSVGGMFGISLIQSIQIPSIFKWGAEKGRIQMFIVLFVLVIIGAIAGFLLKQAGLSVDIEKLENILNNFGLVALILLSCLMYFISYKISYKIYKNKDSVI